MFLPNHGKNDGLATVKKKKLLDRDMQIIPCMNLGASDLCGHP